jgi:integrase/recombinase XerD
MKLQELEQRLMTYLHLRAALGTAVGSESKVLESFVAFAGREGDGGTVTSKVVFDWLETMKAQQSAGVSARRLVLVRQFLLHLSAAIPETQVPHVGLLTGYKRQTPFLFTPQELELLLKSAADFRPGKFCSVVLHTILGLIAATGLRASEALGLDRQDVMPRSSPNTILIRETKFGKNRLVPIHDSTAEQLRVYAGHRELLGFSLHTPAFFVSRHRRRLSYGSLLKSFRVLVQTIGLRARNGSNEPTLHSLRHSFVVTRLRSWHEAGLDVETRLAHLATYLGHVDFRETYWYMTATPELLAAAAADFAAPASAGGNSR